MPTSAPNTDISQRADVGIGPYGASLNNNLAHQAWGVSLGMKPFSTSQAMVFWALAVI